MILHTKMYPNPRNYGSLVYQVMRDVYYIFNCMEPRKELHWAVQVGLGVESFGLSGRSRPHRTT